MAKEKKVLTKKEYKKSLKNEGAGENQSPAKKDNKSGIGLSQSAKAKEKSKEKPEVKAAVKVEEKPKEKAVKKPEKFGRKFECPFAPMGESTIALRDGDKIYQLKMMNKVYKIPADVEGKEREVMVSVLKQNGFIDVTVLKGAVFDEKKQSYVYSAVHPEHTDKNPMTGSISLVLYDEQGNMMYDEKGKQISKQVNMKDGIVRTDDFLVYQALIRHGFFDAGKKVKKED